MLLSFQQLERLVGTGVLQNVASKDQINSASIDITLGKNILVEDTRFDHYISLNKREPMRTLERSCADGFILAPGQFVLAQSREIFNLPPDISAEYKLKSSMARIGINHCLAGWCDAGWNGSVLTLELMNVSRSHYIELKEGDAIGQMIFFKHEPVPKEKSYAARGRYNGDTTTTGAKRERREQNVDKT